MNDKTYPISASEGGDNTYTVSCRVYNASRHYAVCLRINQRHDEGSPHAWEPDCNKAIACRECPAQALRKQEEDAGHALFYTPRDLERFQKVGKEEIFGKSYQRGWAALNPKPAKPTPAKAEAKVKPAAKKPKKRKSSGSLHADLVNKIIEEDKNDEQ